MAEKVLASKTKAQLAAEREALRAATQPTGGPERPLNTAETNPNYERDLARQRERAVENRGLAAAAEGLPGSTPGYQEAVKNLFGQRTEEVLATRPDLQILAKAKGVDARVPQPADWRDTEKEQAFVDRVGGAPQTPQEYDQMMQAVYTPDQLSAANWQPTAQVSAGAQGQMQPGQAGQIAAFDPEQLRKQGFSEQQIQQMTATGQQANQAQQQLSGTPQPTNAMLGKLQQALKMKGDVGNMPIGQSELFQQAGIPSEGVGGYAALSQSLNQRRREMGQQYDSYANLVQQVGGQMSDVYNSALDNYKVTMDRYDKGVAAIEGINEEARQNQFLLDKMTLQDKLDKDLLSFKDGLERDAAATGGVPGVGGEEGDYTYTDPETGLTKDFDPNKQTIIDGKIVDDSWMAKKFGVGQVGGHCGTWASTKSTASKVGNSWGEKRTKIDTRSSDAPPGSKLLIPLGVASGANPYGHVALKLGQVGSKIYVAESNRNGQKKISMGVYDVNELNNRYGTDWGYASGTFKPGVKDQIMSGGVVADVKRMGEAGARAGGATGGALGALGGALLGGAAGLASGLARPERTNIEKYYQSTITPSKPEGDLALTDPKSTAYTRFMELEPGEQNRIIEGEYTKQQGGDTETKSTRISIDDIQ